MNAPRVIRVLIADDHAVVREGIRQVLASDAGRAFDVVGEAGTGREAVEQAKLLRPDVVVLDLSMPEMSGLDAVAYIRGAVPSANILVLSIHDHEEYVLRSVRAGAQGYLRKDSSPAELRAAVHAVACGGRFFAAAGAPAATTELVSAEENRRKLSTLTARERDILVEIAAGRTNKEIAGRLKIGVRTVESHREALMRKLDVRGTAALTRFAFECGLA